MPHPLEIQYGLTANELLEALNKRFRAKVALEGAVAEVHMEKKLKSLLHNNLITHYEEHDLDGHPDFSIWLHGKDHPLKAECKNVRNSNEAYRKKGVIVAYKVETQKTRASKEDPSSRFYGTDHFEILGVCIGKKTGNWTDFVFIKTSEMERHRDYNHKLAVMHKVPLPNSENIYPWFRDLGELLKTF